MLDGRDIIMLVIGAFVAESARAIFDRVGKLDDKRERQRNARDAVAAHLRRMTTLIDGLDSYVRLGQRPGLEHIKMVRRVLGERPTMNQHLEAIGDAKLEREVREWFQLAENTFKFEEDYISGDAEAPKRYGIDEPEWERRWTGQYALHSNLILSADRMAASLEPPKKQPKPRTPHVPPEAMLPGPRGR